MGTENAAFYGRQSHKNRTQTLTPTPVTVIHNNQKIETTKKLIAY